MKIFAVHSGHESKTEGFKKKKKISTPVCRTDRADDITFFFLFLNSVCVCVCVCVRACVCMCVVVLLFVLALYARLTGLTLISSTVHRSDDADGRLCFARKQKG